MASTQDRGGQLMAVHAVCLALAWVAVTLRLVTRARILKRQQADDYTMYASLAAYTVFASVAIHAVENGGLGKHSARLTPGQLTITYRAWYICEILYGPQAALTRTSIALHLRRIAAPRNGPNSSLTRRAKHLLWPFLAVLWIPSVVHLLIVALQCDPPAHYWQRARGAPGICPRQRLALNVTIAHSAISALLDVLLVATPALIVWKLQMKFRKKVALFGFFSVGVAAGVIMICRIPLIDRLGSSHDFVYDSIDVALLSLLEPAIGILAGCVATYGPLIHAAQRRLSGEQTKAKTSIGGVKITTTVEMDVVTAKSSPASREGPYGW